MKCGLCCPGKKVIDIGGKNGVVFFILNFSDYNGFQFRLSVRDYLSNISVALFQALSWLWWCSDSNICSAHSYLCH